MFKLKQKQGFTLLELLVVISIIGLLLAMSIVSFTTAQQRGRDARRRGDINNMQRAMEQQFAKSSTGYPTNCTTTLTWLPSGVLPVDPQGTANPYSFTCTSATSYCFCANLEGTDGNASAANCTSYVAGTGGYYCLGNQQ